MKPGRLCNLEQFSVTLAAFSAEGNMRGFAAIRANRRSARQGVHSRQIAAQVWRRAGILGQWVLFIAAFFAPEPCVRYN
jgi:hypothetical protein